jgi:tetratricopeptide (TPR) repeat protein
MLGLAGGTSHAAEGAASPAAPAATPASDASGLPPAFTPSTPSGQAGGSEAYAEFRRRFDARDYAGAVPYARAVLEAAEREAKTPASEEVQVALMNLALTQYLMEDYVAAETSYLRVIELVESSGRPLHARLARAYAGLASAYHDGNRHDLAVASFEQAVALTRRHEGLLTEQQVPLLEKYIDSLTQLGRYEEALKGQRYVLRIAVRKHGTNSVKLVPTLENIGRWYGEIGAYDQSRRMLKRAIDLVEEVEGPNSLELVTPLTSLAALNRRQLLDPTAAVAESRDPDRFMAESGLAPQTYTPSMLTAEGERALQRAATIVEERADPSPVQVADVRTQLGDWFQGRGQVDRSLQNYQRAWAAASRVTEQKVQGKPLTEALFGKPLLLQVFRPEGWNRYAQRPPTEVEVRTVVLEFTVTGEGTVAAPKIVDDAGDAKRAEKTLEAIAQSARYRPRMENGQPVATEAVTFSQPWIVLLPKPDEAPPASEAPAQDAAPAAQPSAAPGRGEG